MATLTYNYADSTVVLGPLSQVAEPHTYDLCARHARSMTAPKGWDLLLLDGPDSAFRLAEPDDLLDVAHAVREDPNTSRPAAPSAAETPRQAPRPSSRPAPSSPSSRAGTGSITGDVPARPGRPSLRLLQDPGSTDAD